MSVLPVPATYVLFYPVICFYKNVFLELHLHNEFNKQLRMQLHVRAGQVD